MKHLLADMVTLQEHGQQLAHIAIRAARKPDPRLDPAQLRHAKRANDMALAMVGQVLMRFPAANDGALSTASVEPAL